MKAEPFDSPEDAPLTPEERAILQQDVLNEIADEMAAISTARAEIKEAEGEIARLVREGFKWGASASRMAAAAGLSRERIYQIRDGRR